MMLNWINRMAGICLLLSMLTVGVQAVQIDAEGELPEPQSVTEPAFVSKQFECQGYRWWDGQKYNYIYLKLETISPTQVAVVDTRMDGYCYVSGHMELPETVQDPDDPSITYTVTEIRAYALNVWWDISLPKSVRRIEAGGLKAGTDPQIHEIIIPPELELEYVGKNAFSHCRLSACPKLAANVQLQPYAFADTNWSWPDALPAGCTQLPEGLFQNCSDLRNLTVPEGVTSIGNLCFDGAALREIALPSTLKTIGSEAFSYAPLTEITLPEGLTSIGDKAFYECRELDAIHLPSTLEHIGSYAFADVGTVPKEAFPDLPNLKTLGDCALSDFTFTEAVLHSSVESVGHRALKADTVRCSSSTRVFPDSFQGSGHIYKDGAVELGWTFDWDDSGRQGFRYRVVKVPADYETPGEAEILGYAPGSSEPGSFSETVTRDGYSYTVVGVADNAFAGVELRSDNYQLPITVRYIGENAFKGCKVGNGSFFPSGLERIGAGAFQNTDWSYQVPESYYQPAHTEYGHLNFRSTLSEIGASAFENAKGIQSIKFIDNSCGLTEIAPRTFWHTEMMGSYSTFDFTSALSLKTIHESAFEGCSGNITAFANNLETIGERAFYGARVKSLSVSDSLRTIGKQAFADSILEGIAFLNKQAGAPLDISEEAFAGADGLQTAVIPAGTAHVGRRAFADNSSLKTVELLGTPVFDEPLTCFEHCTAVETVDLRGGRTTEIPAHMFDWETVLKKGKQPGDYDFGILHFYPGEKLEVIGEGAFSGNQSLRLNQAFPASLREIGAYAFAGAPGLDFEKLVFSEGLTSIGEGAFRDAMLKGNSPELVLPSTVTYVGAEAFLNANMTTLTSKAPQAPRLGGGKAFGFVVESYRKTVNIPEVNVGYHSGGWEYYIKDDRTNGGGSNSRAFLQNGVIYDVGDVEVINRNLGRHLLGEDLLSCDPAGWAAKGAVVWSEAAGTEDDPKRITALDLPLKRGYDPYTSWSGILDLSMLAELEQVRLNGRENVKLNLSYCPMLTRLDPVSGVSAVWASQTQLTELCVNTDAPTLDIDAEGAPLSALAVGGRVQQIRAQSAMPIQYLAVPAGIPCYRPDTVTDMISVENGGCGSWEVVSAPVTDENGLHVVLRAIPNQDEQFLYWLHNGRQEGDTLSLSTAPECRTVRAMAVFTGTGPMDPSWIQYPDNGGGTSGSKVKSVFDQQDKKWRYYDSGDVQIINQFIDRMPPDSDWKKNDMTAWEHSTNGYAVFEAEGGPKSGSRLEEVQLPGVMLNGPLNFSNAVGLKRFSGNWVGDQVTGLNFSGCTSLGADSPQDLDLSGCGMVFEFLDLSGCTALGKNWQQPVDFLQWLPNTVKHMNISGCTELAEHIQPLAFQVFPHLHSLLCSGCPILSLDLSENPQLRLIVCDEYTELLNVPPHCTVLRVGSRGGGTLLAQQPHIADNGCAAVTLRPAKGGPKFLGWNTPGGEEQPDGSLLVMAERGSESVASGRFDRVLKLETETRQTQSGNMEFTVTNRTPCGQLNVTMVAAAYDRNERMLSTATGSYSLTVTNPRISASASVELKCPEGTVSTRCYLLDADSYTPLTAPVKP